MMGANPEKEYKTMFENGTFAVLGPDGKQVQCDVLFTYDCEDNGRSYVVFTTGEGAQQRLFANRYDTRDDGQPALFALENEQEYAIIKHCFEELKAKLAEQAAEAARRVNPKHDRSLSFAERAGHPAAHTLFCPTGYAPV